MLCYVLMSAVIWSIAKFIPNERAKYKQIAWIAVNTFRMMTGTGPNQSPRALTARVLIFFWAVFSFYWTSSYTTILISMITTPQYLRNVISHRIHNKLPEQIWLASLTDQQHGRYIGQSHDNWNGKCNLAFLHARKNSSDRTNFEAVLSLSKCHLVFGFCGQESVRHYH